MGRTPNTHMPEQHVITAEQAPLTAQREAVNALVAMERGAEDAAQRIATDLGYDGAVTVQGLEDEIRFYQRRTVEACLELGKRLLILKELTQHGGFAESLERLGIEPGVAQRFIQATQKYSKAATSRHLEKFQSQSKLLELVVLDDSEAEALMEGEAVRGITLDDVECMTVRELRAALRAARDDVQAKDRVLADKNRKIDSLTVVAEKRRLSQTDWPAEFVGYIHQVQEIRRAIEAKLGALDIIRTDAMGHRPDPGEEPALDKACAMLAAEMAQTIDRAEEAVAGVRHIFDRTLGLLADGPEADNTPNATAETGM